MSNLYQNENEYVKRRLREMAGPANRAAQQAPGSAAVGGETGVNTAGAQAESPYARDREYAPGDAWGRRQNAATTPGAENGGASVTRFLDAVTQMVKQVRGNTQAAGAQQNAAGGVAGTAGMTGAQGTGAQANDWAALMQQTQQAQLEARAEAIAAAQRQYEIQQNELARQAEEARRQAYVDARLSAIGNNEALAAQGLAGNLYGSPATGYSETSRVAQDIGLRNDLATISAQELQARSEIDAAVQQLIAQGRMEEADLIAQNAQTLIQYQMQQDQFDQQMELAYAQLAEQRASRAASGSGGSYSSGGGKSSSAEEEATLGALLQGMYASGDPMAYYYEVLPYLTSSSAINQFYEIAQTLSKQGGSGGGSSGGGGYSSGGGYLGGGYRTAQEIKDFQVAMNSELGLNLAVDGIVGPKTEAAWEQWQAYKNSGRGTGIVTGPGGSVGKKSGATMYTYN